MTKQYEQTIETLRATSQNAQVSALLREMNIFREAFESVNVQKTVADFYNKILKNETLVAVGETIHSFKKQAETPGSRLNEMLRAASQWALALENDIADQNSILARASAAAMGLDRTWKKENPRDLFEFLHGKQSSELYELLRSGRIAPAQIQEGLELASANSNVTADATDFSDPKQSEGAAAEVIKSILESGGIRGVSSKALSYFLAFIIALGFIMELSNKSHDFYKNISEHFQDAKTPSDIRSLTRQPPAGVERADLSGLRIVTGDNLNLRDGPHMGSLIVQVLPIGTPVQVLDDSQRSWISVSAIINGDSFEGWVLRRYTKRIP